MGFAIQYKIRTQLFLRSFWEGQPDCPNWNSLPAPAPGFVDLMRAMSVCVRGAFGFALAMSAFALPFLVIGIIR